MRTWHGAVHDSARSLLVRTGVLPTIFLTFLAGCDGGGQESERILEQEPPVVVAKPKLEDFELESLPDPLGTEGDVGAFRERAREVDGYTLLNWVRSKAGMVPFAVDRKLQLAAENHARYMATNKQSGHYESEGHPGFSGVGPTERAIAAGYASRGVSENVSFDTSHTTSTAASIEGLMGAIYHRFGFLDFYMDEVGIAARRGNGAHYYAYNMGTQAWAELCEKSGNSSRSSWGAGLYVTSLCHDKSFSIPKEVFERIKREVAEQNPELVLWPVDGDDDVPPAFYEEDPDPLPRQSVSGYPVSVQFNPMMGEAPSLSRFELFDLERGVRVDHVLLMDHKSDPNGKFTPYEFALFPLQRLAWGRTYRAEIDYWVEGRRYTRRWSFTTRNPGSPFYTVKDKKAVIRAIPGRDFFIYTPPLHGNDGRGQVQWRYFEGTKLQYDLVDLHTLKVNIKGDGPVKITFHGREITVEL